MKDVAEALVSSCVRMGHLVRAGDRRGQWTEQAGIGDALMRPVAVIEALDAGAAAVAAPVGLDRRDVRRSVITIHQTAAVWKVGA
jgi:hypothetical protein